MNLFFANPGWLYALLAIVPLIIIYLIKPREVDKTIPSLMFILGQKKQITPTSFLKRFVHDPLFLIQLLIIALVALALAQPIMYYQADVLSQNMIIIIDASASSQYNEALQTRFEKSIDLAKEYLGSSTTIILAKDIPEIILEKGNKREARYALDKLEPTGTETNIGDAMLLAENVLLNNPGRVIVFSDFMQTAGTQIEIAQNILKSRGNMVELVQVGSSRENIGIVAMEIEDTLATIYIKNYNSDQTNFEVYADFKVQTLNIPAGHVETALFSLDPGTTKIQINSEDDFALDDIAYASIPEAEDTKILLISNNVSPYIQAALVSQEDVSLEISRPPVVTEDDFDIYVIEDINSDQIISGTFEHILDEVEDGAAAIIFSQTESKEIDYKGLLVVELIDRLGNSQIVNEEMLSLSKDIDFGSVEEFFSCSAAEDSIVIATAADHPILVYKEYGSGSLVYFGIEEDFSDFHYDPEYPVLWYNLVQLLTKQKMTSELNKKTASSFLNSHIIDSPGFYEASGEIFAVSLLDQEESSPDIGDVGIAEEEYEFTKIKQEVELPLEQLLLLAAFLLLLFEIWFVKKRGDL